MKKKIIFLLTILILATACSSNNFKKINLNELQKKLEAKETFILYLTDESDDVKTFNKTIEKVAKNNNLTVFYLNTLKLKDNDLEKLKELFTYEDTNFISFIKNGEEETVLSRISDTFIGEKKLTQEFINQGYIKEKNKQE